ncbi:MAG TPA: hypothetical protein VGQ26_25205 [Streptosporangiaceae bacterium]|nr:hypothetical protein [Streptosporangiaceae bacterium]
MLGRIVMKLAAIAAAALAAGVCVTACGWAATSMPAAAPSPSCHQQYEAWKHGVVGGEFAALRSAFTAVVAAVNSQDVPKLSAALNQAGTAARRLSATPPPRCADPKGYYGQMLAKVTAAADDAKAAGGLSALITAAGRLKTVPGIERKLKAELDQTVGASR